MRTAGISVETSGRRSIMLNSTPVPKIFASCFCWSSASHTRICWPRRNCIRRVSSMRTMPGVMVSVRRERSVMFTSFTQSMV